LVTITVASGASGLVTSISTTTLTMDNLRMISIDNQTPNTIWICQVSMVSEVAAQVGGPGPPAYQSLGSCPGATIQQLSLAPANNKVYMGFLTGLATPPDDSAMQMLFAAAIASNDQWFLTPIAGPIMPLRITGCVDIVLTPQTDPNPPHNVHPKIDDTVHDWTPNNALMWIQNDAGPSVVFYVEVFYTNVNPRPPTFSSWPLTTRLSSHVFPFGQGGSTTLKCWYGFAFSGVYATPEAYFAAHPQGGGHHTQELPPASA
jgi:hypothetical protein